MSDSFDDMEAGWAVLEGEMERRAKAKVETRHIHQHRKGKTVRSWCVGCGHRRILGVCSKDELCIEGSERTASPVA